MQTTSVSVRRTATIALLALTAAAATASPVEYAIDDGGGTFNLGPSNFDAWTTWGNVFDTAPGGETITDVSVSFSGSLDVGTSLSIGIWQLNGSDDDPTNSTLISRTDGLFSEATSFIGNTGLNEFATYDVVDANVTGRFFVGVIMFLPAHQTAARLDGDTSGDRSWLFYDMDNNADLSNKPYGTRMSDFVFPGAWLVRANGVPTPSTAAVLGLAGLAATRRRR